MAVVPSSTFPTAEARRKGKKMPPKYRQIADSLLAEIRSKSRPGDKLPGEVELAQTWGVHVMTIREAMKVLQAGGVIQRKKATGTVVLNPMGGKWVAILSELDLFSPITNAFFHRHLAYHVRRQLMDEGLPTRISVGSIELDQDPTISTCFDFLADVEADRLSGLVALGTVPDSGWLEKLAKRGVPIVGTARQYPSYVVFDDHSAYQKVLRKLMNLGKRKGAWIGWLGKSRQQLRPENFPTFEITSTSGPEFRLEHILGDIHPSTPFAGRTHIKKLLKKGSAPFEVLIIADEHLLADALNEIAEHNISIPDDLVVICSRSLGASTSPVDDRIIFVDHDPATFATALAQTLIKEIQNPKLGSSEVLIEPTITWAKQRC